tara:strand:- start:444 stop:569 length:126 start_codon:yes stop_codon:yes gene_type:complete
MMQKMNQKPDWSLQERDHVYTDQIQAPIQAPVIIIEVSALS